MAGLRLLHETQLAAVGFEIAGALDELLACMRINALRTLGDAVEAVDADVRASQPEGAIELLALKNFVAGVGAIRTACQDAGGRETERPGDEEA